MNSIFIMQILLGIIIYFMIGIFVSLAAFSKEMTGREIAKELWATSALWPATLIILFFER